MVRLLPVLVWILAVLGLGGASYSGSVKPRFESRFRRICGKYPFVAQYLDMQQQPRENYVIYVFHEPGGGGGGGGGLGDRLGGMITALAFALRTNRQFVILGDKPFTQAFQPYQGPAGGNRTWGDWNWAGWRSEFTSNMTYNRHCVNPKPKATVCALDRDTPSIKVIKFRGNRAYLCRWAIKPSLQLQDNLKQTLGIDRDSDLYEAAGCLLRLAMWPSDHLWRVLDASFTDQHFAHPQATAAVSPAVSYQVSVHFRCGDSSFSAAKGINRECVYDPAVAAWKGTNFADDFSKDSPVDLGHCGKAVLGAAGASAVAAGPGAAAFSEGALAYIASDYPPSATQINATLGWGRTIVPKEACHVDLKRSNNNGAGAGGGSKGGTEDCTLSTTSQWLMLALSDVIVMQSLQPNAAVDSPYKGKSPETAALVAPPEELGPISAFSRYAALYALEPDVMRYGLNCTRVNKRNLSWQTMGNWLCDPRMFH